MRDTRAERARFTAAIQKVALLTGKHAKPDKATMELYWTYLKEFSLWQVEQAAEEIIKTETELISLPPPGRWRIVAQQVFELRPPEYRSPKTPIRCAACDDTGWRPSEDVQRGRRGVVVCECRSGGTPPEGIDLSLMQSPLTGTLPASPEDEWGPQPGETEIQRRRREWGNVILTCGCCARPYRRRQGWPCCGPPSGVSANIWMAQWHIDCDGPGKNRCPTHCPHPNRRDPSPLFEEAFEEAK
jgi:hypothetical protein